MARSFSELMQLMETSPPTFHEWGGVPQVGGLSPKYLQWLNSLTSSQSDMSHKIAMETGAGISSLFFLVQEYTLYSFSLQEVIDRLRAFLATSPEHSAKWHPFPGYSEETLSTFTTQQQIPMADFCFLDGAHSIGSVFLDFVYLNRSLKKNGILVIDDTQLPGPSMLAQMLKQMTDDFKHISTHGKAEGFQKLSQKAFFHGNMPSIRICFPEAVD